MLAASALAQPAPCANERDALHAKGVHYTVQFRPVPRPSVGTHFALFFSVCTERGVASPDAVTVDARMPSHGHGMNYRPTVAALGSGRYRAEGLMFHMPGEWELTFVVKDAAASERITHTLVLK